MDEPILHITGWVNGWNNCRSDVVLPGDMWSSIPKYLVDPGTGMGSGIGIGIGALDILHQYRITHTSKNSPNRIHPSPFF